MHSRRRRTSGTRRKRQEKDAAPTDWVGQAIKDHILQRTSGRIQMLEVEVTDAAVIIHGAAPSYYVKQLALRGVLDVIVSAPSTRVELDVHVMERREEGNSTPGSGDLAT